MKIAENLYRFLAKVAWLAIIVFVSGCGDMSGYVGLEGNIGLINASLTMDSDGNVVLQTNTNIPIFGMRNLGSVNMIGGLNIVIQYAQSTRNHLFLVWRNEAGEVLQTEYDMKAPFRIEFTNNEWVKDISSVGSGNVVVNIEISGAVNPGTGSDSVPAQVPQVCLNAPEKRLTVGNTAEVCTISDRLALREHPYKPSADIEWLAPGSTVLVIGEAQCSDNEQMWFWQVRTGSGNQGWMSEGGDEIDPYFLCP